MKKLTIVAAMAIAAASFTACGNSIPSANLKNDIDSVSYAIGMAQSQGLKDYLVQRMGVDSAYMDQFLKGLKEGVEAGDNKAKAAYYAGIQIGQQISTQMKPGINHELFGNDSTKSISMSNFLSGFVSGTMGKKGLMTLEQAQQFAQSKMDEIKSRELEKTYGAYKKQNVDYLTKYAKEEGVQKLSSGVLYKVIKAGNGPLPKDTSTVKVNYEGKTIDGKVFDSSYKRGEPVTLHANQVIPGWTDALIHMPVGSTWEVVIPQEKAYGVREQGEIKPFSTLIFKIELLGIGGK